MTRRQISTPSRLMAVLAMCTALGATLAQIGGRTDICPAAPHPHDAGGRRRHCDAPSLLPRLPDSTNHRQSGGDGHVTVASLRSDAPERGVFRLPNMARPEPLLDCQRIRHEVVRLRQIGVGAVKQVFWGNWGRERLPVAVSIPQLYDGVVTYLADFQHGVSMLELLEPHPRLVQLVGSCGDAGSYALITEYHSRSSADTLQHHLDADPSLDTTVVRFRLCLDYAEILAMLHGVRRVMCDSSTLPATLRQYLLTDDLRLVLNDVDALPMVSGPGVICGPRPLDGEFVAPEQRSGQDGGLPEPYDERTDVWKIPAVCEHFLGTTTLPSLAFQLFALHRRCRSPLPGDRPTAAEVLYIYRGLWQQLFSEQLGFRQQHSP